MTRQETVDNHVRAIAAEILGYIKDNEKRFAGGWVPASEIKQELGLNYNPYPQKGQTQGQRGWLFGIAARILEDQEEIEYKSGTRSFCRSR